MLDFYLNTDFAIKLNNFDYLSKEWQCDDCDLCGYHSYTTIIVYLKDKRFLVYGNIHDDPDDNQLLKVGKVHWWGRSFYDLHDNDLFTEKELTDMHL